MNTRLSVIITNYNTHHFVYFLLRALARLSSEMPIIYIHDNGSESKNFKKLLKIIKKFSDIKIVLISTIDKSPASFAHGNALDRTIKLVDTKYFCIFDSDCVPLQKGWDDILIARLESGFSVVGSPFWSGKTATHAKYNDFPAQFLVMFKTADYLKANTTCQAFDRLERDTCMQWKTDFNNADLRSEVFTAVSTRESFIRDISPVICTCYYIDDKLIGSHFGRGHEGGIPKYNGVHSVVPGLSMLFRVPILRNLTSRLKARLEFRKWKFKLKSIMNKT
jgi:hypothetical protein